MLAKLPASIQALILDMDGVLYRQNDPIGDLPKIFERIEALGLKVMYATNSTVRPPEYYAEKLRHLGVENASGEQVITSPLATAFDLHQRYPQGGPLYIIGENGLTDLLEAQGFYHQDEDVLAVVSGLDRHFNYQQMVEGVRLILKGVPFIGTNPDMLFPTPDGPAIGTGGVLAVLEACTGVKPEIIGKPFPAMIEMALERLGLPPQAALVVGDRLDTDIAAGQAAGCHTALVLSGISTVEQAAKWQPQPDFVVSQLSDLLD